MWSKDGLTKSSNTSLLSVQGYIDSKEFAVALDLLKAIPHSEVRNFSRIDASQFYFLKAWCHYELGSFERALTLVRGALRLARPTSAHELFARAKQLKGIILSRQGRFGDAIEEYLEAHASFKRAGRLDLIYGVLVNLGLCQFSYGNIQRAEQVLSDAEISASKHNSRREIDLCRRNLARCYVFSGSFKLTLNVLKSLDPSGIDSIDNQRLLIGSQVHTFLLEYQEAKAILSKIVKIFGNHGLVRDQAVCLEYLGLNEYFAGNYEKARDYYNQVLAMPEPTASAVAQTLRMLTDVEVAEGNWDKAESTAAKAEAAIMKISEKIELGALWRAYGDIYTHKQDYTKAREFFEKSIDLLKALGARYELALSHLVAGQSASFTQEQRVEQLQAAKALFIDMEVPKRIEQVDRLLSALALQAKTKLTIKSRNGKGPSLSMIVESAGMRRVIEIADRIKDTEKGVLITGETGTGKDLLAQYIHQTSLRKDKPYVTVNSANFQEALVESELFGHAKGSFTSSTKDKPGLIETAQGGTFVFDEIGELPLYLQAKLLRVVDTKTIWRIGETKDRNLDVRFIALTNRNLETMVQENKFRSDLLYRLNEVHLAIPPMRERPEDLFAILMRLLAEQNVALAAEDVHSALLSLNGYSWPANVRQLQKLATDVALAAAQRSPIEALRDLLWQMPGHNGTSPAPEHSDAYLREVLARNNGNYARAARALKIPLSTFRYRLHKDD